jgi:hypothetical protein
MGWCRLFICGLVRVDGRVSEWEGWAWAGSWGWIWCIGHWARAEGIEKYGEDKHGRV